MTEAELLADRATGIGGSDISSVLNTGYGCALRLYRQKRGEVPDYPREVTPAMELGKLLEPWIAQKFSERHVCRVWEVGVRRGAIYQFLLVHADRLYMKPKWLPLSPDARDAIDGDARVLEVKAVGSRVFYKAKNEGLPIDYYLQLIWGIGLWEAEVGAFALCNRDTGEILDWEHVRDDALLGMASNKAIDLWVDIQAGNPPARLDPDDQRCARCEYRKSCQGNALIHIDPKAKMENDESLRPLLAEYEERKKDYEIASESLEAQKEAIKCAVGDRPAVACGDSKVYYKPQTRHTWAAEEMATELCKITGKSPADVERAYKREGMPFRSLRIY
jgi:predicted phage-related endonuclease